MSLVPQREFNQLMAAANLTAEQISDAKKLRRKVKNRQSARVCTARKRRKSSSTENAQSNLRLQFDVLTARNSDLQQRYMNLQEGMIALQHVHTELLQDKAKVDIEVATLRARARGGVGGGIGGIGGVGGVGGT